ncbi:5-taurinomethyluridine-[tRNA] synthase subunit GTPB3, mitochondrial isoform X1 [Rhynchophorus ferrugineus]|uniref:5-taurinomethyluridine-[tRNA] synthase subunit GTPB3, mitochondrial isoform X1 n=2 Tax=Rhynchophorus ferrugineus TaxID=354439 RepID=UPI003FCEE44F
MFGFHTLFGYSQLTIIRRTLSSTIFALSSGQGKCGVAVVRVSGPRAGNALICMTGFKKLPTPRLALLRSIRNPITKDVIDKGLVLWFPGPNSFTGEDSCEFHIHGGIAVVTGVLEALSNLPQTTLAEPGEFTKRAFINGKLDLTEVEGLADLLQAETELQRKQAFLQTNGSLSKLYQKWKHTLLQSVAHIEAHIDFEETETLEYGLIESVTKDISCLYNELKTHLQDGRKGEMLRNGVKTIILGEPNVGKSSLFNFLCQRPVSIVTPISGTTRDVIEVTLNINGYPLVLLDTAGLRNSSTDVIEIEGIQRALEMYKNADLIILVIDIATYLSNYEKNNSQTFEEFVREYVNSSLKIPDFFDNSDEKVSPHNIFKKNCVFVLNKTDINSIDFDKQNILGASQLNVVKISCKTETGMEDLINVLSKELKTLCGEPSQEHPSMNQMRHREQLRKCLFNIENFLKESGKGSAGDLVIMAEYLRKSLRNLGKLLGTITTEDILDVIFKDFCIGK